MDSFSIDQINVHHSHSMCFIVVDDPLSPFIRNLDIRGKATPDCHPTSQRLIKVI